MILILTAGFGDGHNTAARNVAAGLARLAPQESWKVIDVCDVAHPVITPLNKAGYQFAITHAPWIWQKIYDLAGEVSFESGEPGVFFFGLQRALDELLLRHKPKAIITTYLVYSGLLENLKRKGRTIPPVFTVVTDSISVHPAWTLGPSARYFVADEDTKKSLAALGVKAEEIFVSGFPVSLDFMDKPTVSMNGNPGRIMYLPSTNVPHAARTLEALRPVLAKGAHLTLPLGKHKSRLYHTVTRFADSMPGLSMECLGWTNQIPKLLQTHDVVICKAGGAILHEALAATCPAVIDYVVPGQEEGNAELLTRHECGITTQTPEETGAVVGRLLADHCAEARRMKDNMRPLSEPDASLKIAREVLSHLQIPTS
jgi:processive 1,2-diacylglycerol beta-glucosyltransferase